jgi:adenylosuccinate lyase
MHALAALSPLDGRYAAQTLALQAYFSESALMKYRVLVEIEWLLALPSTSFSKAETKTLRAIVTEFSPEDAKKIKVLEETTRHDVKAVEYFLRERAPFVQESLWHFGCTSEDINNLAYALMIKGALHEIMLPEITRLIEAINTQAAASSALPMLSRTHGQSATPTTLGKELANFSYRLQRQHKGLLQQEILGKFHGAVGNFNAHCIVHPELDWEAIAQKFVESLGLTFNPMVTQIEPHDYLAEISQHFSRINTILIGFSRDLWTYISLDYFKLTVVDTEVGSSTMPHKVNPIDFENAEGNLGIANALFEHFAAKLPISRLQRDLSDSTVLRNIGTALGYTLLAYRSFLKGLQKISPNPVALQRDLAPRYEVLTEALQMALRHHGITDAYEQIKAASRGQAFDAAAYQACVKQLALAAEVKARLLQLTPMNYLGLAEDLARKRR